VRLTRAVVCVWPARAAAAAARRRRRLEYGSCSSMLGVARELTVVLHALWQNKALGPRLSASYTFVHMYTQCPFVSIFYMMF
jgi:hypothetical protein